MSRSTHVRINTTTFGPQHYQNDAMDTPITVLPERPTKVYLVVIKGPNPGVFYDFRYVLSID